MLLEEQARHSRAGRDLGGCDDTPSNKTDRSRQQLVRLCVRSQPRPDILLECEGVAGAAGSGPGADPDGSIGRGDKVVPLRASDGGPVGPPIRRIGSPSIVVKRSRGRSANARRTPPAVRAAQLESTGTFGPCVLELELALAPAPGLDPV